MYKLKPIEEYHEEREQREKKLIQSKKTPDFVKKAKFIARTNIWLSLIVVVNFVLDIVPLYSILEYVTNDNNIMLALFTVAMPTVMTAMAFGSGRMKSPGRYVILFLSCVPQFILITLRFSLKSELFHTPESTGIQDVMNVSEASSASSTGFDAASSMVLLITCFAIITSVFLSYLSNEEKESGRFERFILYEQLKIVSENMSEIRGCSSHHREVIKHFEGVIPEALKLENGRYNEIRRQLNSHLEAECKTVRLKIAIHLGDPASMKYLTQQQPNVKIPDYKLPDLKEEEFEFNDEYRKVGRAYYEEEV